MHQPGDRFHDVVNQGVDKLTQRNNCPEQDCERPFSDFGQMAGNPETVKKRSSRKLAGLVLGSRLVGSNLRAWCPILNRSADFREVERLAGLRPEGRSALRKQTAWSCLASKTATCGYAGICGYVLAKLLQKLEK
jgi:hypothetical protein